MITRIVCLTIQPEKAQEFQDVFLAYQPQIGKSAGCVRLSFAQDIDLPNRFFTISEWNAPADLENYRHSELFKKVWATVKPMFAEKAQAWSLETKIGQ